MDISTFKSNLDFIKSLYFHEEWKDEKCRDRILAALEEANAKIIDAFGESMHYLVDHKPSVEAVEKVVQKFPSTLLYPNNSGRIPIQRVVGGKDFEYVPVLAKEGMKHKVGGEDARGGLLTRRLLTIDPVRDIGWNTLQWLVRVREDNEDDAKRAKVLKELQESRLLVKTDIKEQKLL